MIPFISPSGRAQRVQRLGTKATEPGFEGHEGRV